MEELSKILEVASAANGDGYFSLGIDGGNSVYRERVYCYEFGAHGLIKIANKRVWSE